jgi:hypothetical protein
VDLGLQVERIALSSISMHGLNGVKADKVEYFGSKFNLKSSLKSHSMSNAVVLYIPTSWNYPRVDAVLVSHVFKKSVSKRALKAALKSASLSSSANGSADSESPSTSVTPTLPSAKPLKDVVDYIHVEFIQISVGAITDDKLANTRSVLSAESPERELWRQAAGDSKVPVKFSLCWLVSEQEVKRIPPFVGFDNSAEKVSHLSSVNSSLTL